MAFGGWRLRPQTQKIAPHCEFLATHLVPFLVKTFFFALHLICSPEKNGGRGSSPPMLKIGQNWDKIANYPPQCSTKIATPGKRWLEICRIIPLSSFVDYSLYCIIQYFISLPWLGIKYTQEVFLAECFKASEKLGLDLFILKALNEMKIKSLLITNVCCRKSVENKWKPVGNTWNNYQP